MIRIALALIAAAVFAQEPELIFRPLAEPLRLPPGNVETLLLDRTGSFFGDALRAVDCDDPADQPLGICANLLFGGYVLTTSHLSGSITIRFFPIDETRARFEVTHGTLAGEDSVLAAPQGYLLPLPKASVSDVPGLVSEGELDLTTGGVTRLKYRVRFADTALDTLARVNPKLPVTALEFPGPRGRAWARFEQRADGLLDYSFQGSTFVPAGAEAGGDLIRFPLPFCDAGLHCASVVARGTSFRPRLSLATRAPQGESCAPDCPEIPFNTVREFTVDGVASSFGDDFDLDVPALGGSGPGRSHLQGRLLVQFGMPSGGTVPFVVRGVPPAALLADPPISSLLGRGFGPGLIGSDEILRFPNVTYRLEKVLFADEAFNFPQGEIDLRTGRVLGEMAWPSFFGQVLAEELFKLNEDHISRLPFDVIAKSAGSGAPTYALFEKAPGGGVTFRFSGEHVRSFAGFLFPSPDYRPENAFVAGPRAELNLFARIRATSTPDAAAGVLRGAASQVRSSLGDAVSYSYAIPCDGASARPEFEYTNGNSGKPGGTFRLTRLASVSCGASGETLTFSAFGLWSKDPPAALPRLATVQISTAADAPYYTIFVYQQPDANDNVILSSANDKPAAKPLP
ncbi:MAG: hypothetical protein R2729_10975 [Bryobacteraceae bacterium]